MCFFPSAGASKICQSDFLAVHFSLIIKKRKKEKAGKVKVYALLSPPDLLQDKGTVGLEMTNIMSTQQWRHRRRHNKKRNDDEG